MLTIHDQFNRQLRNRLKTTVLGLGLVRLRQDAGRTEEAQSILHTLENGFQGVAEELASPNRKPRHARRLTGVSKGYFSKGGNAKLELVP